ncbi:hypothetical protein LAZ67_1003664 [Cordylochernes scorpioides]|uniref:HTH CENPB-type domain-containing protein n=1 Tax=Cordylochernes scorpioides TaxID=51811 RepID=A0ABY6JYQ0_9ARAC|nr:hypothetical protein LAZ67_1003664 [Cordylochernes scorpioides]
MKIIEEIEQGKSHSQVSRERNIPRSTISTIFKNKFAIKSAFLKSNFSSTLKRDRGGEFPEIEEALCRWIRQANAMKLAINGNILKEKAILLALKMGQDNFKASNGWLEKFKARRNIAFKQLHGEAGSVDANSVATWKGFVMDEAMEEVVEEEMNRCFEALKKHQAIDVNYIDFLEVDKDVQVAGEQSIEEIVKEVMGKEEDEEKEERSKKSRKIKLKDKAKEAEAKPDKTKHIGEPDVILEKMEALKKMRSPLQRLMVRKVAEIERIMEDDPTNRIEILALHLQLKRLGQKVKAVNARIENLRIKESEDQPEGEGVKDSEDEPKGDGVKDSEAEPKSDGVKDSETAIKGYEPVNNSRAVAEGADQVEISDEAESIDDNEENEEGVVKVPALRKLMEVGPTRDAESKIKDNYKETESKDWKTINRSDYAEKCRSRVNALKKQQERLEKGKKKLQAEVEDLSMELESQRSKVMELEKNKSLLKQLRELEGELENERKQRANATAGRKKMEASHKEMEAQLEMANKIKEDALRQLKKLQSQASEAQRECEDLRLSRDEAQGQHKDVDKRIKSLESEAIALQEELSTAERARRSAEAERDDLAEEANSKASRVTMLQDDKRRLETRIHQLEEEMEEEQAKAEGLAERAHRAQSSVDLLTTEVAAERASCQKLENARSLLERQGGELRAKLQERETSQRARTKATIASLESKTCQLEEQLEAEGKERQALAKANRKLDKKVKEMSMQLEDEHRQLEHYKGKDHDANEVKNIDEVHCTESKMEGKLDVERCTDLKVEENLDAERGTDSKMEGKLDAEQGYWLPDRPVFGCESEATPIRPVCDGASCRGHGALALRRYWRRGPILLRKIPEIRIKYRENRCGILADMGRYFQVMAIKENDWDYLRFLWKKKMDN